MTLIVKKLVPQGVGLIGSGLPVTREHGVPLDGAARAPNVRLILPGKINEVYEMAAKQGFLITVRTAKQGVAMEKGKFSAEYIAETSTLTLSPRDYQELELTEGQQVRIRSDSGQALVTCRSAEGPDGVFFLPLGPTANALIGEQTYGTGVPSYKGLSVEVETVEA